MPVTFRTRHHADVLMLEANARELIEAMGYRGGVPGALAPGDVAAALAALEAAVSAAPAKATADAEGDAEERPPAVPLAHRALPLLALLRAALRDGEHVLWER